MHDCLAEEGATAPSLRVQLQPHPAPFPCPARSVAVWHVPPLRGRVRQSLCGEAGFCAPRGDRMAAQRLLETETGPLGGALGCGWGQDCWDRNWDSGSWHKSRASGLAGGATTLRQVRTLHLPLSCACEALVPASSCCTPSNGVLRALARRWGRGDADTPLPCWWLRAQADDNYGWDTERCPQMGNADYTRAFGASQCSGLPLTTVGLSATLSNGTRVRACGVRQWGGVAAVGAWLAWVLCLLARAVRRTHARRFEMSVGDT